MTILVTGANGQLGNEMRIVTEGSKDKYIFTDVVEIKLGKSFFFRNQHNRLKNSREMWCGGK